MPSRCLHAFFELISASAAEKRWDDKGHTAIHIDLLSSASLVVFPLRLLAQRGRGDVVVRAFHLGEPGSIPAESLLVFRAWESCRTIPLIGGFSRGSPLALSRDIPGSEAEDSSSNQPLAYISPKIEDHLSPFTVFALPSSWSLNCVAVCSLKYSFSHESIKRMLDEVAEWLRRWTANPMGSARVGSNPILVGMRMGFFCKEKLNLALSGDGALAARGSITLIARALVDLERGKKTLGMREPWGSCLRLPPSAADVPVTTNLPDEALAQVTQQNVFWLWRASAGRKLEFERGNLRDKEVNWPILYERDQLCDTHDHRECQAVNRKYNFGMLMCLNGAIQQLHDTSWPGPWTVGLRGCGGHTAAARY
ncbi:hypothetical protein PR048_024236 [Dryococelus australis]|uniref:Uncharacterized protein n=1 Tax=Dryococelus australis TaxID=614101 RepID=A0ABQ9GN40_9NEOP|nr:hypothetical protein PR048_024236 [Dryococelus australis]